MTTYTCSICGYVYDEASETLSFADLSDDWCCPLCTAPKDVFKKEETPPSTSDENQQANTIPASMHNERYLDDIRHMSETGTTIMAAMHTEQHVPSWDDILILGAQLNPMPLNEHDEVNTQTIIGKHAKKPMVLESPIYVSHMSFGALSKEAKTCLAKGSAMAKTAMCSGEGGILEEERDASYRYIFEYTPNKYSVSDENLQRADAIEIKVGQGTKPGMGGHLPKEKVTEEIARIRSKEMGHDILSPSRLPGIETKEDMRNLVEELRERSDGRPIGIKISAGHIEDDLEFILYANADFVTIDGRGGATGSSPKYLRDASSVPTIYALHRARRYLDEHDADIDLVMTGGFRISSDIAKALAMGADAIALASAPLIAAGCRQFRICGSGNCPMGIATQDDTLRKRLHVEESAKRVYNYLHVTNEELKTFARISGHSDVHELCLFDLTTTSKEISEYTDIDHV